MNEAIKAVFEIEDKAGGSLNLAGFKNYLEDHGEKMNEEVREPGLYLLNWHALLEKHFLSFVEKKGLINFNNDRRMSQGVFE